MAIQKQRIEYVPLGEIHPYPGNPRRNDQAVQAVASSIREFGFRSPIVVDADGTIIAGHTRYKAAGELGMESVPIVRATDLTPEQVNAYRPADNKTAELAEWDAELLASELDGLAGVDMERFGFDESDFEMPETFDEPIPLDDVVEIEPNDDAQDRVKAGELWRMGDHVLLCADSTDPRSVERLVGAVGGSADMLLTDPPYNIAYEGKTKDALKIENDSWSSDDGFVKFLHCAFSASFGCMRPGAAFYVWHAPTQSANFLEAAKISGMTVRQILVWVKSTFSLGRQDYQWRHELCLYGWKEGAPHYFFDSRSESTVIEDANPDIKKMTKPELVEFAQALMTERTASTVLEFDKPSRSAEHPTMKPVKLFAYLIRNSSRVGDTVLDPFAGSGTTVVACEQLKRRAAVIELDPHYASVVVDRWERLTGKTAVRCDG